MSQRRFERQVRFAPLGEAGQERLQSASVLLVGCGALGGVLAQHMVRAGVGRLVLVDRDVVEETNLPRQVLFDERHALDSVPKVEAAAETLARAGGPTVLETHAVHLDADNIHALAEGCELLLDGTDNMPTRYLMNDYCVDQGVPWVYAGVVSGAGLLMPVIPGRGPCLRCVFRDPPPPGSLPTCDTAGVIAPAVGAVASMQAGLGLRLLVDPEGIEPALIELDAWNATVHRVRVPRDPQCPACGLRELTFLDAPETQQAVSLCGRNTVQVRGRGTRPDLDRLQRSLAGVASDLRRSGPLLRFSVDGFRLTLFPDGRTLVEGTLDTQRALALVDRYIGT
ncbi:MAG: ThiF family adenylyltransferase [Planctomycetota bacterium]